MFRHERVVDIDVNPYNAESQPTTSPTFRLHFHDFENLRYIAESPEFTCFGRRWTASVYRTAYESETGGNPIEYVSFKLTLGEEIDDTADDYYGYSSPYDYDSVDSSDQDKVRIHATVKDIDGKIVRQDTRSDVYESDGDFAYFRQFVRSTVITRPSNNILCDGTLTVELKMEWLKRGGDEVEQQCQPFVPANPMTRSIKNLFMDKKTADVVFSVSQQEEGQDAEKVFYFYAHRLVLQACAKNLAAFCDSSNEKMEPIAISRVHPHVFKLMLFWIYGGTISELSFSQYAKDLINAADLYGVVELKLHAEAWYAMHTEITIENVVDLLVYAESTQCSHLKDVAMDFVVRNKNDILGQGNALKSVPVSSVMFTDLLAAVARTDKVSNDGDGISIDAMRVGNLRRKLHARGLDVDGSRETLIARLQESSKRSGDKRKQH